MRGEQLDMALASALQVYTYYMTHLTSLKSIDPEQMSITEANAVNEYRQLFKDIESFGAAYHAAIDKAIRFKKFHHDDDACKKQFIDTLRSRLIDTEALTDKEMSSIGSHTELTELSSFEEGSSDMSLCSSPEDVSLNPPVFWKEDTSRFLMNTKPGEIDSTRWEIYDTGSCNHIYLDNTKKSILRCPQPSYNPLLNAMTDKERIFHLWQRIYPEYPVKMTHEGLVIPFFGEKAPTNELILQELINIYQRTKIILADAWVDGNFRLYNGKAVCVDLDLGLSHDEPLSQEYIQKEWMFIDPTTNISKFDRLQQLAIEKGSPIMSAVCTLIYLEQQIPAAFMNTQLITKEAINILSRFREQKKPIYTLTLNTIDYLKTQLPDLDLNSTDLTPKLIHILNLFYIQRRPIDQNTLNTLFYLEKNIPIDELEYEHLIPPILNKIHVFRDKQEKINGAMLRTLDYLIHNLPQEQIKDEYLTVKMMGHLNKYREEHLPIDLNTLQRLQKITRTSEATMSYMHSIRSIWSTEESNSSIEDSPFKNSKP